MGDLRTDLTTDEVRETHISLVFMGDGEVHKVKKPVYFGFLDFRTLAQRKAACRAEVELNRRLSPDVYLGVVPVTRRDDGTHAFGGEGEIVDWAVHMRRLPDEQRADALLAAGDFGDARLEAIAARIARFHREARSDQETARFGQPSVIGGNVRENFEQTRTTVHAHLSPSEAEEIERWQLRFLEEAAPLFEARIEAGHVRDGHGDLRLEHVYFEQTTPTIIDCIEFNERFRYGDTAADVAFLSMDLAFHGRVDLSERFLALYARESNDLDLYRLIDFYESYRAWVRGKIAAMAAADPKAPSQVRERASEQARRYFVLALAADRKPLVPPSVIAVGGLIATGKSTLADRLTAMVGGPAINTDRTRKHMLGAEPTAKLYDGTWSGAYDLQFTEQVYAEVYRRAGEVLRSGRPVILDASFRSPPQRAEALALARAHGVPFRFVECRAPAEVCKERLRVRALGQSVSDGRLEIFDDFAAKWVAVDELPPGTHIIADTTLPEDELAQQLREALPAWPAGLTE